MANVVVPITGWGFDPWDSGAWGESPSYPTLTGSVGSVSVSGANHRHNARGFSLQPSIASVGITLGSGQGYQIGYRTSDSGSTGQAILDSGTLSMSGSVSLSINNNGGNESRPQNIAMMYVIKT